MTDHSFTKWLLRLVAMAAFAVIFSPTDASAQYCCAAYAGACSSPNCVTCEYFPPQGQFPGGSRCMPRYESAGCGCAYYDPNSDDCNYTVGACNYSWNCISWCGRTDSSSRTRRAAGTSSDTVACAAAAWEPQIQPRSPRLSAHMKVARRLKAGTTVLVGM